MEYSRILDKLFSFIAFLLHIVEAYWDVFYTLFVPPPMRSLTGEIILITGSAKGLGKSICKHLAQFKVTLILWDCDELENIKTAQEIQANEGTKATVFPYRADVSSRTEVEQLSAKVKEEVGDVTIIINNAGIAPISQFLKTEPQLMEKTFQVNVLSHFWILREFLPRMIESHHGHIATVCSLGAFRQDSGSVPYFGSKAAVHGYMESLKLQLVRLNAHGIRCTTIYPYFMDTGMLKDVKFADNSPLLKKLLPFLNPDNVAEKFIEGIRRSYEYVYFPKILHYILKLDSLLPLKLRREVHLKFEDQFQHPNFPQNRQKSS